MSRLHTGRLPSRLLQFLKPTPYKLLGTLLVAAFPLVNAWASEETALLAARWEARYRSSGEPLRDLETTNAMLKEMEPLMMQMAAARGTDEAAAVAWWAFAAIGGYLISCLLVERPALRI